MAGTSNIEWTDATWNPVVGCSIVSPGCTNCYAMRMAARIEAMDSSSHYAGTTKKVNGNAVWTGKVALAPDHILTAPLRWKKPRKIFVNSMGDLFHESIPDEWIDRVFAVMALCLQHTFQVLTKRAERMREYFVKLGNDDKACEGIGRWHGETAPIFGDLVSDDEWEAALSLDMPLENVWLGVSAERQQEADERIPHLLATPAAVRFVSLEPLLGPIDLRNIPLRWMHFGRGMVDVLEGKEGAREGYPSDYSKTEWCSAVEVVSAPHLNWVIVGGESGPGARPMDLDWARNLVAQCRNAGIACFVKQIGAKPMLHGFKGFPVTGKGIDWSEWPEDLRMREMPNAP